MSSERAGEGASREDGLTHISADEHEWLCRNGGCPGYEFHSIERTSLVEGWRALMNAPIQFWTCPNREHRFVTWTGRVAVCDECGRSNDDGLD